jgi:hypothetical protein
MFEAINEFLVKRDMDTYAIYGLWLVFLFAVLSSIMHVAAMFGDGDHAAGILPALAIDGGLALATYALGRFQNNWVKGGFFAFMFLSVFANLDYTLQRVLGGAVTIDAIGRLDLWQLIKVGAKASPPLIGAMMMEINTGVSELKKLQAPPTPTTTALATTTNHVANQPQQPVVNVAPSPQQPQQHRLKRPQPALTTLPTMPVLQQQPQQPVANSTHKSSQQPPQQPDNELVEELVFANQQPLQGLPIPTTQLAKSLAEAVVVYAGASSYDKAGARLNVSGEWIRKQVRQAYEEDPAWVAQILPAERLPK